MNIAIKRGATFRARVQMDTGLKGWNFTSKARLGSVKTFLNNLTCREIDVDGACVIEIECPTDNWPTMVVIIDIRAEQNGEVILGETIQVSVSREVTDGSD